MDVKHHLYLHTLPPIPPQKASPFGFLGQYKGQKLVGDEVVPVKEDFLGQYNGQKLVGDEVVPVKDKLHCYYPLLWTSTAQQ